ncbi:MAG: molybdenum cofactor biosynthesis protein MoaE [Methylococcaceae bacterium]|nr:molybdenum cofactor biosynthesis protein MoaE [Methylococcaceae bacterium]
MIKLCATPLDPWQELQSHQATATHLTGQYGATSIFVGTMRDFNQGDAVKGMMLEHYPGMTEKVLANIVATAERQWAMLDCLIVHRIGMVRPDQPIVLVAVWSAHRGDAFDACRAIMEALKSTAPFWKKEQLESNRSRWVNSNSNGYLHANDAM